MHNFEDELTCPICYSIFEDCILPCSHTFVEIVWKMCYRQLATFIYGDLYAFHPSALTAEEHECSIMVELNVNFCINNVIIEKY